MTRRARGAEQKKARRAHLIQLTQSSISRRGVAATSLTDVASNAGITAPALYGYFKDRHELLRETLRTTCDELLRAFVADDDPDAPAAERIQRRLASWVEQQERSDHTSARVLTWALLEAPSDEALAAEMERAVTASLGFFRDVIEQGQARGEIRPDVDVDAVVELANACILGVLLFRATVRDDISGSRLHHELVAMLLDHLTIR